MQFSILLKVMGFFGNCVFKFSGILWLALKGLESKAVRLQWRKGKSLSWFQKNPTQSTNQKTHIHGNKTQTKTKQLPGLFTANIVEICNS